MISRLILPLLFLLLCLHPAMGASSPTPAPNNQQFRSNPYEVLHVDPLCSQKEIQRQYRKLCLKYHPDKKRNGDEPNEAGLDDDFEFKEVQHAYSLIGTEEDRRNYEVMRKLNHSSFTNRHDAFSRYAATNNGFGARENMFGPSTIYFTFGDGLSFKFSSGRNNMFRTRRGYAYNNPFFGTPPQRRQHMNGEMSQQSKPHFIQRVSVPLHVLYAGADDFELKLRTSLFERYRAAFHGGVLTPILLQSALTVLLTWLRSQKINWFLSALLFTAMVHAHLPPPPEKVLYSTKIRKGWKSGTKIKYSSAEADVTFVLQESSHSTFTRVGNDLHTQVEVSAKQLRKGCTLKIKPMCDLEEPIKLKLGPREVQDGQFVTIKSRGWPKDSSGECGNLRVKICCSL